MKRATVSVCLTTYNGERFLRQQLRSVLSQLADGDELVVFDDGSSDLTLEIVSQLMDPRVKLHAAANVGHVKNFERALSVCTGQIVFLCDQDDIWCPTKIESVLSVFESHPTVSMVHHEREIIDSSGAVIGRGPELGSGTMAGHGFLFRQLIRPKVFGCCLAFRAACLRVLLPFPSCVYAHDHWATIVGALTGGVFFLSEPLIQYRQHSRNVTPKHALSFARRVVLRRYFLQMQMIGTWRTFRLE